MKIWRRREIQNSASSNSILLLLGWQVFIFFFCVFSLLFGSIGVRRHTLGPIFFMRLFLKIHTSDQIRNQFHEQFEHVKVFGGGLNRDR